MGWIEEGEMDEGRECGREREIGRRTGETLIEKNSYIVTLGIFPNWTLCRFSVYMVLVIKQNETEFKSLPLCLLFYSTCWSLVGLDVHSRVPQKFLLDCVHRITTAFLTGA